MQTIKNQKLKPADFIMSCKKSAKKLKKLSEIAAKYDIKFNKMVKNIRSKPRH